MARDGVDGATPDGATPFPEIEARVGREVLRRFRDAERVEAYGMRGWRIRRPRRVDWTHGTVDPNFVLIGLAERRQGTTLHVWNPLDWKGLGRRKADLEAAGFKVMVGCLQFARKRPYPVAAVAMVLDDVRALLRADRGEVPPYRTPRPRPGSAAAAKAKVKRVRSADGRTPVRAKPAHAARGKPARGRATRAAAAKGARRARKAPTPRSRRRS